jgi:hypothetical protein
LKENPKIVNLHKFQIKQKIVLPAITGNSPVLKYSDGAYKIWLGTFLRLEEAKYWKDDPAFKGEQIVVIPQKGPAGVIWYRVVWGGFHSAKECSAILESLREKGKLPIFEGLKDKGKISKDK